MPIVNSILGIQNLPLSYLKNLSSVSEDRLKIIKSKLVTAIKNNKTNIIYICGTAEPIYKIIRDDATPSEIMGIDFEVYFDNCIKGLNIDIPKAKYIFVYNVGTEKALKVDFSSKLLKGILKKYKDLGSWVFIESDLPYTKFVETYKINITNNLRLPTLPDDKLF